MSIPEVVGKQYTAVPGSHFTDDDAKIIGPFIDGLMDQLGRKVTTEEILAAAEPEESPIHPYFDWDDTEAARQWRLNQARYIARSYQITIVEVANQPIFAVRGTVNLITGTEDKGRTYIPIQDATSPENLPQIVAQAKHGLLSWISKYRYFRNIPAFKAEFEPVFKLLERRFAEK